jgi:hypothetical protein
MRNLDSSLIDMVARQVSKNGTENCRPSRREKGALSRDVSPIRVFIGFGVWVQESWGLRVDIRCGCGLGNVLWGQ